MLPNDIWHFFHPELNELTLISPRSPHYPGRMSQVLNHFRAFSTHHNYKHNEYIHTPTVDIRETDSHYYFDIEMPGVTDRENISIQWTSSRTLVVEGTILRPDISLPPPDISLPKPMRPAYNFAAHGGEVCDDPIGPRSNSNSNSNWPPTRDEDEEDVYDPLGLRPNADYNGSSQRRKPLNEKRRQTDASTHSEPFDLEQGGGEDDPNSFQLDSPPQKATKVDTTLKRVDKHDQLGGVHLVVGERVIGHFKRDFCFPVDVDRRALKAVLVGGLLTIKTSKMVTDTFHNNVEIQVE